MAQSDKSVKRIGTHSGNFHCDDVLACYMLRHHTATYRDCEIIRTRNPSIWPTLDIIVDVGDEFDPINHRFDHHQSGFEEQFDSSHTTKLSSAGLVFKYFGKEIIRDIIQSPQWNTEISAYSVDESIQDKDRLSTRNNLLNNRLNDDTINIIWNRIYDEFVEFIDANDNGIKLYDNVSESQANYRVTTTISARVNRFNPSWNDPMGNDEEYILKHFYKAMEYIGVEFREKVLGCVYQWLPARAIVEKGLKEGLKKGSKVVVLEKGCPWQDHFWELLSEMEVKEQDTPLYVLFEATNGSWRVRAVPKVKYSFETKKGLPVEWRAKRKEELDKVTGIEGCVFVHATGFIGGNETFEGAMKMAQKAVEMGNEDKTNAK